jgi:hypothetical protein
MVAKEMAKGCSRELAEQKVMYAFGRTLPRSDIAEGMVDTVTTRFMKRVDDIMIRDCLSDRSIAMQKARQEHPGEFEIFQLV